MSVMMRHLKYSYKLKTPEAFFMHCSSKNTSNLFSSKLKHWSKNWIKYCNPYILNNCSLHEYQRILKEFPNFLEIAQMFCMH